MNTYEITFTRENGSTGKDRITAANEKQARKDFREIYRIYQKIPRTGYICPHCESRLRAGETLPNIQASQKARPQRTKGATL